MVRCGVTSLSQSSSDSAPTHSTGKFYTMKVIMICIYYIHKMYQSVGNGLLSTPYMYIVSVPDLRSVKSISRDNMLHIRVCTVGKGEHTRFI